MIYHLMQWLKGTFVPFYLTVSQFSDSKKMPAYKTGRIDIPALTENNELLLSNLLLIGIFQPT